MQLLSSLKAFIRQSKSPRDDVPAWQLQHQHLQPLKTTNLPQILPEHQSNLALNGWATVEYNAGNDPLSISFQELLQASKAFFELPESYKQGFKTKLGTEEGWSRVEGEKEFIAIRTLEDTPEILKDAAAKYWAAAGGLLNAQMGSVAASLGLPADSLTVYSEPCSRLETRASATMLRLFRYEGYNGQESKVVAEEHKDLGLLSLVAGDTPGLEVWDRYVDKWFCIEKTYRTPAASVLVGRQLELLSNGRYYPGSHRVRSYPEPIIQRLPTPASVPLKYRYSIVFVLRAHSPVLIDTDKLTNSITGDFKRPVRNITAGQVFKRIYDAHFNINSQVQEREEQKRKLAEMKNRRVLSNLQTQS